MHQVQSAVTKIVPVILSGGMGTRLWPMSRVSYPKQFLTLTAAGHSLIQQTVLRVSDSTKFLSPVIVANHAHRFLIEEKMHDIEQTDISVILEPAPRNTAAAIAAAAHYIQSYDKDAYMLVLPSDHFIADEDAFMAAVMQALCAAQKGHLVTFGIKPEYPETGFGYICHGERIRNSNGSNGDTYTVDEFVEKPDIETAAEYISSGNYLWNSGMFLFPVKQFLKELKTYQPEMVDYTKQAVRGAKNDGCHIYLEEEAFTKAPPISVDYALMEHTKKAAVVSLDCRWSDIGSWDALWRMFEKDEEGNICRGTVHPLDTRNCYISTTDNAAPVATIGVENLVIISTRDCVMVADKRNAQAVKCFARGDILTA